MWGWKAVSRFLTPDWTVSQLSAATVCSGRTSTKALEESQVPVVRGEGLSSEEHGGGEDGVHVVKAEVEREI